MSSTAELVRLQDSVRHLLQDVWEFAGGLGAGRADHGASAWLVDGQWRHFRDECARLAERSDRGGLSVAVVGTPKSGKTTFVNALLGSSCLPTNGVLEAPGFCIVHHILRPATNGCDNNKFKLLESSGLTSVGSQAVRQRLQELLEKRRHCENVWNMERPLEIYAPLQCLAKDEALVQLSLIDMPSLQETKTKFPILKVEKCLQDVDAVVYVLNYTKLKSPEEAHLLQAIRKINPSLMKRAWQRMFFAVNKIDAVTMGEGLSETQTRHHVKTLLWEAGVRVQPEQILLISANNALLSRLVLDTNANQEMRTKFGHLVFGPQYGIKIAQDEWRTCAERMLEDSGIQQVEEQVFGFLHSHSSLVSLLSLLDDVTRLLQEVGNVVASYKASLSCTLDDLTMYMERLKAQLDTTIMEFDAAKIGLQKIEDDVTSMVQQSLQKLKSDLLQGIRRALSDSDERPIPDPGWRVIHETFVDLMARQEVERTCCEDLLKDLHEDVTAQIQAEIDISWSMVSELARERHQELLLHTNELLDRLSHRMESLMGRELGIHVSCSDMTFEPPSTAEFHTRLDELLQRGVQEHNLRRSVLYWYMAGGSCTVYAFDAIAIRTHFETLVCVAAEQCLKNIRGPLQDHMSSHIQGAKARLQEHGDHYVQAVQSTLDGHAAHISSHAGVKQTIMDDLKRAKHLHGRAVEMLRRVEAWLQPTSPMSGRQSTGCYSEPDCFVDESDETESMSGMLATSSKMHRRTGSGGMLSGRQIPQHRRFSPQEAVAQMFAATSPSPPNPPLDRSESMPTGNTSDVLWDSNIQGLSAQTGVCTMGGNDKERNGSGNGDDFGVRKTEEQPSNWRASQGSQFRPKSDFFRSYDKALHGGRAAAGRKPNSGHRRTISWA
eukprot:evm.model.scf_2315.3 EVM.evm.TU.scf_2315.3   scf_2315:7686-14973(+)